MKGPRPNISGYRGMWLFALFDLPVETKTQRRQYTKFRKELLKKGFTMLQYSVYARYVASEETGEIIKKQLKPDIPPEGQVRILMVTDKQFGKMEVFYGERREAAEDPPMQLSFF